MTSELVLQISSWHWFDRIIDDDCDTNSELSYTVLIYGTTNARDNVCIQVHDFTPFFYVQLPRMWRDSEIDTFNDHIQSNIKHRVMVNEYLCERSNGVIQNKWYLFENFQDNEKKPFLRLRFSSMRCFYAVRKILQSPITINGIKHTVLPIHETNIMPMLRLIHQTDVKPCGWIAINDFEDPDIIYSEYDTEYKVSWKSIKPVESSSIGPLLIAAWDIEADSSHGDFPLAKKDYTNLVNNLIDMATTTAKESFISVLKVKQWLEYAFRNGISGVFDDPKMLRKINNVYLKDKLAYSTIDIYSAAEIIYNILNNLQISGKAATVRESRLLISRQIKDVCNKRFPKLCGDKIIQIGLTWQIYNDPIIHKYIATLGTCDDIEGVEVEQCTTEVGVIYAFSRKIGLIKPHVITGYNIFGFDFKFMWDRAKELGCEDALAEMSILRNHNPSLIEKELQSAALGQNFWYYPDLPGINILDIMKIVQRDHNLSSYKLDSVSSEFIHGKILSTSDLTDFKNNKLEKFIDSAVTVIETSETAYIKVDDYLSIYTESAIGRTTIHPKCKIIALEHNKIYLLGEFQCNKGSCWGLAKDDVSPKDIFRLQKGNSTDRAIIAKYCVKDCELCLDLLKKLELISNNVAMSNVCLVPLNFLFTRGQMIKTLSLVSKECKNRGYIIPLLAPPEENDEEEKEYYEGAIVLQPKRGIYIDETVSVVDYGSLYPSSMISGNLSQDTWVTQPEYQGDDGKKLLIDKGYDVYDIEYDNYVMKRKGKSYIKVIDANTKVIKNRFILAKKDENGKINDSDRGILPQILLKLLGARKATRAQIKKETDQFKINVLEGQQLAFKLTANSLYGGIGAGVSALHCKAVAASTTATGRNMLYHARDFTLKHFPEAEITYGDTDSLFINFHPRDELGNLLKGKENLCASIKLGIKLEKMIQPTLEYPHKLEYEKSAYPFILLRKKGYVYRKYEEDPEKWKLTSMGVVTKRRDNAPIVKHIYAGVVDLIMEQKSVIAAASFVQDEIRKVCNGEYPLNYFIITKSLRADYKTPEKVVHKILADRMAERDPGNAPKSNDRIPYVFIEVSHKVSLQGEKVEHPDYIKENNLKVDYVYYIIKQILKPVCQIFALEIEELRQFGYNRPKKYYEELTEKLIKPKTKTEINQEMLKLKSRGFNVQDVTLKIEEFKQKVLTQVQADEKIQALKAQDVAKILFEPIYGMFNYNGQTKLNNFYKFRPFIQLPTHNFDKIMKMSIDENDENDENNDF
tara:strand:- start:885 stop:4652 length:3768 start_codon:yes stop_codon:yes gene_type:complete